MVLRICMGTATGPPGVDAVEALQPASSTATASAASPGRRARSVDAVAMALVQAASHDLSLVVAGLEAHAALSRQLADRGGGRQRAAVLKGVPGPPLRRSQVRCAGREQRGRASHG